MIPVGYMAKRVCKKPDWLQATQVIDIYSVFSGGFPTFFLGRYGTHCALRRCKSSPQREPGLAEADAAACVWGSLTEEISKPGRCLQSHL